MRGTVAIILAVIVAGQVMSADAVVRQPYAEIRGGRSTIFPVTGMLRQGQPVRVVREEGGWIAIAPPEGSSSWVMERILDQQPAMGQRTICVVLADEAPVLLGGPNQNGPYANQVGTLKRGTMVVVLGEKASSDAMGDKTVWWRIQPAPNEVRWLAKESTMPSTTAFAPPAFAARSTSARALPQLWLQAEQAERAGNLAQAALLFRQAAAEQSQPGGDYDLAMRANQRADILSRAQPPVTAARPAYSANGGWTDSVMMTSGPGVLRRAAFQIEGAPAFVLEDARGYPRVYVIAQTGMNLDPYVNRYVELFGPMTNRPEMSFKGYMTVQKMHLLR